MYELVNTSVPKGLIAGTHGYSTVAMTKGMPNIIRERVESFCAYSHRTSAHDQSYYAENPVNWFHLTLPGGDHVVGRAAPCEFDYTGRTNRISRTLYFKANEMPLNGGAYILASEASRLSEAWSGEPRYLKEDKTACGRLRLANPPTDTTPRNWIQMFGDMGVEYARKFALLLEQNLRGANKSIYFKVSTADVDGARLLGLFSDLINLMPQSVAPQVTFSTFSACVPSGVTCHLRGIFDKDRAFEVASALQPWVDCESGTIKHEELLPSESARLAETESHSDVISAGATQIQRPNIAATQNDARSNYRQAQNEALQRLIARNQSKSNGTTFAWWKVACGIVILIGVVAVGGYFYVSHSNEQSQKNDEIMQAMQNDKRNNEWLVGQTNWIADRRKDVESIRVENKSDTNELKRASANLEGIGNRIRSKYNALEDSLIEGAYNNYDDVLKEVRVELSSLESKINKRIEEMTKTIDKVVQDAKDKFERDAAQKASKRELAKTKKDNGAIVTKMMEAQQKARELDMTLDELLITKEIGEKDVWYETDELKEYRRNLTNDNSIVCYYLNAGKISKLFARFKLRPKLGSKNTNEEYDFALEKNDAKRLRESPWCVYYIPSIKRVYWQWSWKWQKLLDENVKEIDCITLLFGGDNEAYKCYSNYMEGKKKEIIYCIDAYPAGAPSKNTRLYKKSRKLTSENFELSDSDTDYDIKKLNLEDELSGISNKISEVSQKLNAIEEDKKRLLDWSKELVELKKKPKDEKKEDEKKRKEKRDNLLKEAYELCKRYDLAVDENSKKAKESSLNSETINGKMKGKEDKLKSDKNKNENDAKEKISKIKKLNEDFKKKSKEKNVNGRLFRVKIDLPEKGFKIGVPKDRSLEAEEL